MSSPCRAGIRFQSEIGRPPIRLARGIDFCYGTKRPDQDEVSDLYRIATRRHVQLTFRPGSENDATDRSVVWRKSQRWTACWKQDQPNVPNTKHVETRTEDKPQEESCSRDEFPLRNKLRLQSWMRVGGGVAMREVHRIALVVARWRGDARTREVEITRRMGGVVGVDVEVESAKVNAELAECLASLAGMISVRE